MAKLGQIFNPESVREPQAEAIDLPEYPALEYLKGRRQWVAWKYEYRGGDKPTKPPISPLSGFGASHSKPSTWGSYRQAVAYAERKAMPGVGYVLSHDDNLTGADLDRVRDPGTGRLEPWVQELVDLAETYTEVSPSGTGLRMIWEGKVDQALKSDPCGVEVYGKQRYLTITGRHLAGTPQEIRPAPKTWAALQARVAAWKAEHEPELERPTDLARPISERAAPSSSSKPAAAAGDSSPFYRDLNTAGLRNLSAWVPKLFGRDAVPQGGTGAYRVSSKALGRRLEEDLSIAPNGIVDFGLHDMGDGRRGKRTPVDLVLEYGGAPDVVEAATWLCEQLGKTPADFGWSKEDDGRGASSAAALLARKLVETEDGKLEDEETGEAVELEQAAQPVKVGELPTELSYPPGLVGELTDWICDTARRPQRALAIGAALAIVGTAAGRHIAGPTGSGTHLYVVGLAPTGAGKDHAMHQISTALGGADAKHLLGPSQFISMPAVINFLARAPLSVCVMDEFGSFLKRINSRRASGFEGAISGVLRTAWGASFKPMATPEWAGKSSEVIEAPALSIYGASTADEFYGALEGGDTSNGVLNRLLVIETSSRPQDRSPRLPDGQLPKPLAVRLQAVLHRAGPLVFAQLQVSDRAPPVCRARWGPGAELVFNRLVDDINRLCDRDAALQAFYARAAEMAVRLATILAVGCDAASPVVTADMMAWGRDFAMWSARGLERGGTERIADNDNQAAANMVRRAIREAGGRIKHRDLLRRLNHRLKNRDLHDMIKAMSEAGHITVDKVTPKQGGPATIWYNMAA